MVVALVDSSAALPKLIGVTGDGAVTPESLFELDTTNASATFVMALGNGDDGETIGYNPTDLLLYHASGISSGNRFWEGIDVGAAAIVTSGQFTGPGATENTAMVYNPATGRFLVANLNNILFDVTLAGVATSIGTTPTTLKGLAFAGGALYGVSNGNNNLYELDPANGSVISSIPITFNGNPVAGLNGLATDPVTGDLWGVFRIGLTRRLGTVDSTSGVVAEAGTLPDNFAGIAFVPEPSIASLLSGGMIAFAMWRRRAPR